MEPTLSPGDRLYVDGAAYVRAPLRRGDIVIAADPERGGRLLVKRAGWLAGEVPAGETAPVPAGSIYLLGDREEGSRDSRSFGPVPLESIVGRAYFRYAPPERRGALPQR